MKNCIYMYIKLFWTALLSYIAVWSYITKSGDCAGPVYMVCIYMYDRKLHKIIIWMLPNLNMINFLGKFNKVLYSHIHVLHWMLMIFKIGAFRNWPQNTILKTLKVFNHDNSLCFDCQEYELRQYSASSWMSTNTAGVDYSKASSTNFMRLFRYISGTNTDSE